jgi:hypothetical protein
VKNAATLLHEQAMQSMQVHQSVLGNEQSGMAFYVAGYDGEDSILGELYRCEIPGEIHLERTNEDNGLVWNGEREIVDRIIYGYDPRLRQFMPDDTGSELIKKLHPKLQLLINFQTMTLQDAVHLAHLLVHTSIEILRLSDGIVGRPGHAASCGGSIDVAVIVPGEGFQWLRKKTLSIPS